MNGSHAIWRSMRAAVSTMSALIGAACAAPTETSVQAKISATGLSATGTALVLLPGLETNRAQRTPGFFRCVEKELSARVSPSLTLMNRQTFQDALFPWFEAEQRPTTARELDALLARPLVRERITELNVRYVITMAGATDADGFPGILCGAGYGGAGCLGVSWENRKSSLNAVIWDLLEGKRAGDVVATSAGKSFGFAFVLPVLFVAYTEREACTALATELGEWLLGRGTPR